MESVREKIIEFLKTNGEKCTSEVAKAIGLPNDRARYYLNRLVIEGRIKRRAASDRVVMWKV